MGAAAVLRSLWERRLAVAIGSAVAIAAAVLLTHRVGFDPLPSFESRQYHVGLASAEVLVDSPNSQVIDLGGSAATADVASLSVRARLLADLVATSPLRDRIARRVGIPPTLLIALRPSTEKFSEPTALETGATVRMNDPRAHILSLRVHEELPIIGIDAQAPDARTAARISDSAVAALDGYLKQAAATTDVPDRRKLVIDPLGPARSSESRRGPGAALAALIAVAVLMLWCAGVLVVPGTVRALRQPDGPAEDSPVIALPTAPPATRPRPPAAALPAERPAAGPERPAPRRPQSAAPPPVPVLDLPERPAGRRGLVA